MSLIEDDYTVSCDLLVAEKNLKISTAEDAKRICDAIKQLNELKTLKLEGISLGIEAAEAIADTISHCPSLEVSIFPQTLRVGSSPEKFHETINFRRTPKIPKFS